MATHNRAFSAVVAILFVITCQISLLSAFHLEIDPANFDPIIASTVIFRCGIDSSDAQVRKVDVIEIFKEENQLLATISQDGTTYATGSANKFQVDGQVGVTADQSFLRLNLLHPKEEDSGVYTCVMYYEDATSLQKMETNKTLTVNTMLEEIEVLQTRIRTLQTTIQNKDHTTLDRISNLKKRLETHSNYIDDLNSKGNVIIAFSASLGQELVFSSGKTIVFDHIIMQKGQAYSRKTGVFTAPRGGVYFFYLALGTKKTALGNYVNLMVNGKKSLVYIEVGHPNWWDNNSANALVKLTKGDTVKVVMVTGSGPFRADKISIFGGFCIRPE